MSRGHEAGLTITDCLHEIEARLSRAAAIPPGGGDRVADPSLVKAIARGHVWFDELGSGQATTIAEIATRERPRVTPPHGTR